jgi:peptidoglycan/LPS O-acetylase OafA/YrhL
VPIVGLEQSNPMLHNTYRRDIDGLRAIAVISVIVFHAFPEAMPGGFIGVDMFFVISGFLITGIIINSLNEDRFSLFDFYIRRIRRIFPSLILVIFSVLAVGYYVLFPSEYKQLGKHKLGGAAFIANLMLLGESGYFDTIGNTKPLLHLWSLSVEEQFYLAWPLILTLNWRLKLNSTLIIAIITII